MGLNLPSCVFEILCVYLPNGCASLPAPTVSANAASVRTFTVRAMRNPVAATTSPVSNSWS